MGHTAHGTGREGVTRSRAGRSRVSPPDSQPMALSLLISAHASLGSRQGAEGRAGNSAKSHSLSVPHTQQLEQPLSRATSRAPDPLESHGDHRGGHWDPRGFLLGDPTKACSKVKFKELQGPQVGEPGPWNQGPAPSARNTSSVLSPLTLLHLGSLLCVDRIVPALPVSLPL